MQRLRFYQDSMKVVKTKAYPREILNKLKWDPNYELAHAEIWYLHRGAPNDLKIISGSEITKLNSSFIYTSSLAVIPYHRILKIVYEGETLWERRKS